MNDISTDDILKTLETLYSKGEFEQGVELLKSKKDLFSSPNYHFNLGTFFLKSGELPLARYHLELAKSLNFNSSMVSNNLDFVRNNLGVTRIEQPKSFLAKVDHYFESSTTDFILGLTLSLFLLGILVYRKTKITWYLIIFFILGVAPATYKFYGKNTKNTAIVLETVALREGPSDVFEATGEIPAGLKVRVSELREKTWYLINYPREYTGWVNLEKLKFLDVKK